MTYAAACALLAPSSRSRITRAGMRLRRTSAGRPYPRRGLRCSPEEKQEWVIPSSLRAGGCLGAGSRSRTTRVQAEIQAPRRSSCTNRETRVLADRAALPDEDAQPGSCGEPALKAPQPHDPRRARTCHGRERAPGSATAGSDARTTRRAYREDADERSPRQHRAGDPDDWKWAQQQRAAAGRRRAARRRWRWRWRRRSRDDHLACGHRLLSFLLLDPEADGVRARLRK